MVIGMVATTVMMMDIITAITPAIASLMLEKYIRGKITRKDLETRILARDLRTEYNRFIKNPINDTLINVTKTNTLLKPAAKDSSAATKSAASQG